MRALVLTVPLDDVELASDALWGLGVVAVEERALAGSDGSVELWTSLGDDVNIDRDAAAVLCWVWRFEEVDDRVAETWRDHAQPVMVDDDLMVCPAWVVPPDGFDGTVVRVEPGSTFGLGDHPTTMLTMRAMRRVLTPGATVLDVGCGSGVLAVAAAMLGAAHAHGIDIAPAAVPTTVANAERNGVADRVTVDTTPLAEVEGEWDVVLANILAPELVAMAADLVRVVAPGGTLVISGILAERHQHVLDALALMQAVATDVLDGWAAVTLR